jgi:hypothetical protein
MAGGTVGKVVVAAGVAEWVLNGVDQRGEQFVALRMPADIPSEQGRSMIASSHGEEV